MESIKELKEALSNNLTIVWNDPDHMEGTDYIVNGFADDLDSLLIDEQKGEDISFYPLTISYNKGESEAEVFLGELEAIEWDENWYEMFPDADKLYYYHQNFVDWVLEVDTWAYTYTIKNNFKSLYELIGFYLKEF